MATNVKYQNISVQRFTVFTVPRTGKTVYELPRENLTEDELGRKSTSDRTKRRVAHKARFPLPVITKPIVVEKPPRKLIKKLVIKKDGKISFVKKTVASVRRVQHIQAVGSGIVGGKSTTDRTKPPVAHIPVITKPGVSEKQQEKQIKSLVLKKDVGTWRVKPSEVNKQITERVVLDTSRAQHSQSSISGIEGVDDRAKRKSEGYEEDEVTVKKTKKRS